MPLNIGDIAPDFEMMNQDKTPIKLSSFRGQKKVVLLFYPMDFSPVCTDEFCAFGPNLAEITADGDTVIFGISTDSPFCHAAFRRQYGIPCDLLADVNRTVCKAYDLFMGEQPFNCGKRGTVVIGKDGKITHWHEQPTKEGRSIGDLSKAASA